MKQRSSMQFLAVWIVGAVGLWAGSLPAQEVGNPLKITGKTSEWHGFQKYDFPLGERHCSIVAPEKSAKGNPWVWRARFFGHEPQADIALLKLGYHIAYCDVAGLYGSPKAVAHWDAFYAHVVGNYDLARKVALEGMSRGGLIIYNWAAKNPDKVACLYGDAPVCDIRSWPGGKGSGAGSPGSWKEALDAYGLTEESAQSFKGNPIDQLAPLADAKIPILHVVGDADKVVPIAENSDVIEERYRKLGGKIEVIHKPGVGHHPHALKDPARIVVFITKNTAVAHAGSNGSRNVLLRRGLPNSRQVFQRKKQGHVAFIGGSITEMNGYRPMVCDLLQRRFPETEFMFTDAGISSTCSTTGAFRLEADVLSKGPVDLFFIEFAVNDDQDAVHARRECIRGLEGLIRQAHRHNPAVDIVVTYFVNPPILEALQDNKTPVSIASHDAVTSHYRVPTIHLAQEIADRISTGRLTWKQFGGTHPAPYGNRICADLIGQLFDQAWAGAVPSEFATHALPDHPLDPLNYENGRFVSLSKAIFNGGDWNLAVPDWKSIKGNCRTRFREVSMLSASEPGAELALEFEGTAAGAYVLAGPDAGILEVNVDGKDFPDVDLYHRFSKGLHYPRTAMLATGLAPGNHTLRLRVSAGGADASRSSVRIVQFVAN